MSKTAPSQLVAVPYVGAGGLPWIELVKPKWADQPQDRRPAGMLMDPEDARRLRDSINAALARVS